MMTNADRIRNMTNKELSSFILGVDIDSVSGFTTIWDDKYNCDVECENEEEILKWLGCEI